MKRKAYGARQDSAWRQSVKDYSPNGGRVYHRDRRRKATLQIIQDSDEAPSGWSYIRVGERWNGRGKYVDLFLEELAASPEPRSKRWTVDYGDSSNTLTAIDLSISEERVVQRDKLQYHVNIVIAYNGLAPKIVRERLRDLAPGFYDTTVCRTEESREEAWQILSRACQQTEEWLRHHLHNWKNLKCAMLANLVRNGEVVGTGDIFDGPAYGVVADTQERFKVYWNIHADIEKLPSWEMHSLPGDGSNGALSLPLASDNPIVARDQLSAFLGHLNVTRPIEFGGRRRIEE